MEALVNAHYEALYRYAYRLSGGPSEAEDLTQETFCKAQASLRQLREPEKVRPWLFRILRNVYLQCRRHERRLKLFSLDGTGDVADHEESLPEIDSEELQNALNDLPESFRTPLILYYFEEFSYSEIAEQVGVPIGTVMSRLARAKAHLRERLLSPVGELA